MAARRSPGLRERIEVPFFNPIPYLLSGKKIGRESRSPRLRSPRKRGDVYIKELWRYPVKSMAGEALEEIEVGDFGFHGDRLVQVYSGGRLATARSYPALLALKGTLGSDDEPRIDGISWRDPEALALARAAVDERAILAHGEVEARFDILPLSIATDGAIAFLEIDGRRLRPNLVVGDVEGLAERSWPGHQIRIGSVVIDVHRLRPRCVMTTWDPDTQEQDITVLKRIGRVLQGAMSLDCSVVAPGVIRSGDPVRLL